MAQKIYVGYQLGLDSWLQNTSLLGVLNPGRYCGFNSLTVNGMDITLGHTQFGVTVRDANNIKSGPFGKWLSPQGTLISEDSPMGPYTLDDNSSNDYWRYDVLYGEHHYKPVSNHATLYPAIYGILKGPTATSNFDGPAIGTLSDPDHQVILAIIAIPPNASDLTGISLYPVKGQDTGDHSDAKIALPNAFQAIQQLREELIPVITPTADGWWELGNGGNTFRLVPTPASFIFGVGQPWNLYGLRLKDVPLQFGTKITLQVNNYVKLYNNYFPDTGVDLYYNSGYRPLKIPKEFCNYRDGSGNASFTLSTSSGSNEAYLDLELINDYWVVTNIRSIGSGGQPIPYMVMDKSPKGGITLHFATHASWAGISLNLTGTPTKVPFAYRETYGGTIFGEFSGSDTILIREAGLVRFSFSMMLAADTSGLSATEQDNHNGYAAAGTVSLGINVVRAISFGGIPAGGTEVIHVAKKHTSNIIPHTGVCTDGSGGGAGYCFSSAAMLELSGEYTLYVQPGDLISPAVIVEAGDSRIAWHTYAPERGACKFEAHYLGHGTFIQI